MENILVNANAYFDKNDSSNSCHLCEKPDYELRYRVRHYSFPFQFMKCKCGLIKQCPMPTTDFFQWFFNSQLFMSTKKSKEQGVIDSKSGIWGYADCYPDEPCRLETSKRRYKKLSYIFDKQKLKIMKIGPATGTFLYVAKQHGHDVLGCEVSGEFSEFSRKTYDIEIHKGRFEKIGYQNGQFDVILALNVIENVPNLFPFLDEINRTLSNNGYFIINFVNIARNIVASLQKDRYFLYRPPVCYLFTLEIMRKILDKSSFVIEQIHRDVRILHLDKIFGLLGISALNPITEKLGISQWRFPIWAYPSLIIVARKKAPIR